MLSGMIVSQTVAIMQSKHRNQRSSYS